MAIVLSMIAGDIMAQSEIGIGLWLEAAVEEGSFLKGGSVAPANQLRGMGHATVENHVHNPERAHQATHYNSVIVLMGTWIFCSTNYGNFWRTDASPGRWHDFDEQKRLSVGHIKSGFTSLPLPLPHMVSLEISAREPPPLCLPEIGSYA